MMWSLMGMATTTNGLQMTKKAEEIIKKRAKAEAWEYAALLTPATAAHQGRNLRDDLNTFARVAKDQANRLESE